MKIKIALGVAILALAGVLTAIVLLERQSREPDIITLGDTAYATDLTELDLSGSNVNTLDPEKLAQLGELRKLDLRRTGLTQAQYAAFSAALPDCEILWDPWFQGQPYPQETDALTTSNLTETDVAQLAFFPQLTLLDATGCRDYALLRRLQENRPDLTLKYSIYLGGEGYPQDTASLTLTDPDEAQFDILEEFPQLTAVSITGALPQPDFLNTLADRFPEIAFHWEVDLLGTRYASDTVEIDLTGTALSGTGDIEKVLPYLPRLQKMVLCDCGLDTDVMGPLQERHPEVKFVWWMDLGSGNRVRTDATAFCAEPYGVKLYDSKLWQLKYCDQMVCLDLGHMPIRDCSFVANMPDIKYLILAISYISDLTPLSNAENLVFLEIFKTEVVDYTPLLSCTALEDLNVCGSIGAEWETLTRMTWLKRLYLGWDGTSQHTADTIAAALPDTQVVLDPVGGSTGGNWRQGQHYYDMRDMLGKHYMEK